MRAALRHRDRVREISFGGSGVKFGKFIRASNYHFPALENLVLCSYGHEPDIPSTFHFSGDQNNQIYVFDVSNYTALPSHPYLDFYCPQRFSPTSLLTLVISRVSTRHKERSFLPVCKVCNAYAVSIWPTRLIVNPPSPSVQLPKNLSHY
jgi:hypothetical protein